MTTYYTKEHEWAAQENGEITVGITSYAQEQLGDVVFVELPTKGSVFKKGEALGVIESVKAASEFYAPADLEVLAVNEALEGEPALVNKDPHQAGWILKARLKDPGGLADLMDKKAYEDFVGLYDL